MLWSFSAPWLCTKCWSLIFNMVAFINLNWGPLFEAIISNSSFFIRIFDSVFSFSHSLIGFWCSVLISRFSNLFYQKWQILCGYIFCEYFLLISVCVIYLLTNLWVSDFCVNKKRYLLMSPGALGKLWFGAFFRFLFLGIL